MLIYLCFLKASPQIPKDETISTLLGNKEVINCYSKDALYCVLLDPHKNVHTSGKNCTAELTNVRMKDVGVWNCQTSLPGKAEMVVTNFIIKG